MAEQVGRDRWLRQVGTLLGGLALLLPVLALGSWRAQGLGWSLLLAGHHAENVAIAVWEGLFGAVLVRARPRNPLGWWMLFIAAANALTVLSEALADRLIAAGAESPARWAAWLAAWLWATGLVPLYSVLLAVYPSGRASSRAGRVLVRCALIATGLLSLGLAVSDDVLRGALPGQQNPLTGGRLAGLGEVLSSTGALASLLVVLAAVAQAVLRLRSAASPQRQQLAWLLTTTLPVIVLLLVAPAALLLVATVLSPLGIAVGVLRYRLLDIQLVLRRTLVYGLLTGLVALCYAVVVAAAGRTFPHSAFSSVLAAALVAVGLRPAHQLVQVAVTRLVYGDEPARAVRRLANAISDPARGGDPLATVVEVICSALKLPAAVLIVDDRATGGPLPEGTAVHELVLRYEGEPLGLLLVAARRGETRLRPADVHLLEVLSGPIGLTVHATRMNSQLKIAQTMTQQAAAEERARLRQDLHDGLGPSLCGVALGLEAAQVTAAGPHVQVDAAAHRELLNRLHEEVQAAIVDVRRLVEGLRPVALDGMDLLQALEIHAHAVTARSGGRVLVGVTGPAILPPLPDQIVVAVYRIALEALTNVVRHAHATRCQVRLRMAGDLELELEVTDDGCGLQRAGQGMGVSSMCARATALGGSCEITQRQPRGTRVLTRLPLPV